MKLFGYEIIKEKSLSALNAFVARMVFSNNYGGSKPVVYFKDTKDIYIKKGFEQNHVIFTVFDWVAKRSGVVTPLLYSVKNKKKASKYSNFKKHFSIKNITAINSIKKEALSDEIDSDIILDILERPNPFMNWSEFVYAYRFYLDFVGIAYIYGVRAENSTRTKGFQELYILPSDQIEAISGDNEVVIKHYRDLRRPNEIIPTEDILVIRNFGLDISRTFINGYSKLKSASRLLQKTSDATDAETETLQNRGANTIVFPRLTPDQLASMVLPGDEQTATMQEKLRKTISEAGNNGVALNSIPLDHIQIGLSPIDMGILDSKKIDEKAWCSLWHVSDMVVLNNHEAASYDTMQQSKVSSITDGVIPDLEKLKDGLNNWFVPSHDSNKYIDFDYTEYPEIYEELFKVAKDLKDTEAITIDEIREVLKYAPYDGENGDKILVSSSKKILDEITFDLPQINPNEL
jgi:hypothetical protein